MGERAGGIYRGDRESNVLANLLSPDPFKEEYPQLVPLQRGKQRAGNRVRSGGNYERTV